MTIKTIVNEGDAHLKKQNTNFDNDQLTKTPNLNDFGYLIDKKFSPKHFEKKPDQIFNWNNIRCDQIQLILCIPSNTQWLFGGQNIYRVKIDRD